MTERRRRRRIMRGGDSFATRAAELMPRSLLFRQDAPRQHDDAPRRPLMAKIGAIRRHFRSA